jgi:hypothetical protein
MHCFGNPIESVPQVTTSEKKNGFLLIETFRKLFNAQNHGHLEQYRVAFSYNAGSVGTSHFCQPEHFKTMRKDW